MDDESAITRVNWEELKAKFALERSHKSMESNSNIGKAMGQAVILISGGAATAILTFISKDSTLPLKSYASWAIMLYAAGVVFGALVLYSLVEGNG